MRLELAGFRVNKCDYNNQTGPNMKVNLQVSTGTNVNLPKEFKKGSVGSIITKMMVGNPMQPLYLYFEMVCNFIDVEATEDTCESYENMVSVFKTVCVPMAMQQAEKVVGQLCMAYNIPPIKLQKNPQAQKKDGYLN